MYVKRACQSTACAAQGILNQSNEPAFITAPDYCFTNDSGHRCQHLSFTFTTSTNFDYFRGPINLPSNFRVIRTHLIVDIHKSLLLDAVPSVYILAANVRSMPNS